MMKSEIRKKNNFLFVLILIPHSFCLLIWTVLSQITLTNVGFCRFIVSRNFTPNKEVSLHTSQDAHQDGTYLCCLKYEATQSISTPAWMEYESTEGLPPG